MSTTWYDIGYSLCTLADAPSSSAILLNHDIFLRPLFTDLLPLMNMSLLVRKSSPLHNLKGILRYAVVELIYIFLAAYSHKWPRMSRYSGRLTSVLSKFQWCVDVCTSLIMSLNFLLMSRMIKIMVIPRRSVPFKNVTIDNTIYFTSKMIFLHQELWLAVVWLN